jgi:hypothetical protein
MAQGCSTDVEGPICLSPAHKNVTKSNIIGAAAYWGNDSLLKQCIPLVKAANRNFVAVETSDSLGMKNDKYTEEFKNFTPDFLAAASPHSNVKCMMTLLAVGKF